MNGNNKDFAEIIDSYDRKETLFYLDPPYVQDSRVAKNKYQFEMTNEQHEDLLKQIVSVKGLVILSGYDNKLYNSYLKKWHRIERKMFCHSSAITVNQGEEKKRPKRIEVIWLNPAAMKTQVVKDVVKKNASLNELE